MQNYNNFLVDSYISLKDAMKKLENLTQTGYETLYVLENNKLLGTLCISDIRRALVNRDISNSMPVVEFIKRNFHYLIDNKKYPKEYLEKLKKFRFVPVVSKQMDFIKFVDIAQLLSKPNKVVLMAGGLGSRLGDLTKNTPKPMLKIGEKPILEIILEQFKKYHFYDFYISVNYKAEKIIDYFKGGKDFDVNIKYIRETNKLGTVGCLSLIKKEIKEPIVLMNGDVICNIDFDKLLDFHKKNNFLVTVGATKYSINIPYGVLVEENSVLKIIEEKPTKSYLVSGGIYVINPEVLKLIPNNEYYDMPMLIDKIINTDKVGVFNIENGWIDIGKIEDFLKVQTEYAKGDFFCSV
jgi:dTDP-glucose pyrophosphorylase